MKKYKTLINGVAIFGTFALALVSEALPTYALFLGAGALACCGVFIANLNDDE